MDESVWVEISQSVAAAPYPVEVLPADSERSAACLAALGVTTRSWLGAVVANSGGLVVDHGWLRVLGGGHDGLPEVELGAGGVTVAYDVLGGRFDWMPSGPGSAPTVHYFGPEDLAWEDLEFGYGDWLHAMLSGAVSQFYEPLRWPGWADEVAGVRLDQGISTMPPLWTAEGKDLSTVSRKPIRLGELVAVHHEIARQLDDPAQAGPFGGPSGVAGVD